MSSSSGHLTCQSFCWLIVFSIAMGYLESAVVVYLRELYYPNGFGFPLVRIAPLTAITELGREAATIVMLLSVGLLTGKTTAQRFACFLASFAIWDIFYYLFLYVLLGWPQSLSTWDVLFLLPVPWVGPVVTPVVISCWMLVLASIILYFDRVGVAVNLTKSDWLWLSTGSLVVILSWCFDFCRFLFHSTRDAPLLRWMYEATFSFVPAAFNYWIFFFGMAVIVFGMVRLFSRLRQMRRLTQKHGPN